MTRKHFEMIARVLAKAKEYTSDNPDKLEGAMAMLAVIGYDLADEFENVNPNFDAERFLVASKCDWR